MTRLVALALVFASFATLNVYVVGQFGYLGFFAEALTNAATFALSVDLVIALGLIVLWMTEDASERALPAWPYVLLTLGLGSLGPLAYLIHRELRSLRASSDRRATA
jgi:hypothetical protein